MRSIGLVLVLAVALPTARAHAQAQVVEDTLNSVAPTGSNTRLGIEAGAIQAVALALKKLEPSTCRWCAGPSWDSVQPWVNTGQANALSYATLGVTESLSALMPLLDGQLTSQQKTQQSLQLAYSSAITQVIAEGAKILAARERPDGSDALSFFSEHTALAATAAAQSWKHGNKKTALFVLLPATLATGWLRIDAHKHHPLDVFTGLVVGGAVGFWTP